MINKPVTAVSGQKSRCRVAAQAAGIPYGRCEALPQRLCVTGLLDYRGDEAGHHDTVSYAAATPGFFAAGGE